jgi:hypothetical protein
MVARKIFRPNREERSGKWEKLHVEEFFDLFSSISTRARNTDYQIKKSELVGTLVSNGERRGACRVLMAKAEGRKHLADTDMDGKTILKRIP